MSDYLLDPASVGITLNTAGMPTSEGWKYVTPEMWKFRWEASDKACIDDPGTYKDSDRGFFSDQDWYLDATKSHIMARIWGKNPDIHVSDLCTQFLEEYLDTQKLTIRPYEMIVGHQSSDEHGIPYCLMSLPWMLMVMGEQTTGRAYVWENKEKVKVNIGDDKWNVMEKMALRSNPAEAVKGKWPETLFNMYFYPHYPARYFESAGSSGMRANPDHDWYLKLGLREIVNLKKKSQEAFEKKLEGASGEQAESLKEKIINCKSSIRATEAVIRWIKRYAVEAREKASDMPDEKSKMIAIQVANNCEWIAENVPRTFWEAVQLYWLCLVVTYGQIEIGGSGGITFRPDQVFWQWYEKDVLNDKTMSRVQAMELFACLAVKMQESSGQLGTRFALGKSVIGLRDAAVWTLAGQTSSGQDASNDLTTLILDMYDGYRFHFPDSKYRWCTKTSDKSFKRMVEVMRTGLGHPSIKNDEVTIASILDMYGDETTLEEARSWAIVGCNTPGPTINSKGTSRREAWVINMAKSIEFALFNGQDPQEGFEWVKTVESGDPTAFKTYEEFYQAWLKQYEWMARTEINCRNDMFKAWGKVSRRPFLSALYKVCLDTGDDIVTETVTPRYAFQTWAGWVDIMDSLTGVKYCVFDKKKYTMAELLEGMKADWKGYEKMKQDFRDAPKFGNDNDYADMIVKKATDDVYKIALTIKDDRGKPVFANALPLTLIYHHGQTIGALPNGRDAYSPLCDGGLNPHADFDKSGPWARMKSALKIDQEKFKAWIYNMKIDYPSVAGPAGLKKLIDYLKAGLMGGQSQLQVNFLSKDIYQDAQKNPDKYPYLMVRVSGYNAYYTDLPAFVQDAIMARVDHEL